MSAYYRVVAGKTKFIGMAKKAPFVTGNPLTEPGELWFQMGETQSEALFKITDEMIALGFEKDVVFCDGGEEAWVSVVT